MSETQSCLEKLSLLQQFSLIYCCWKLWFAEFKIRAGWVICWWDNYLSKSERDDHHGPGYHPSITTTYPISADASADTHSSLATKIFIANVVRVNNIEKYFSKHSNVLALACMIPGVNQIKSRMQQHSWTHMICPGNELIVWIIFRLLVSWLSLNDNIILWVSQEYTKIVLQQINNILL